MTTSAREDMRLHRKVSDYQPGAATIWRAVAEKAELEHDDETLIASLERLTTAETFGGRLTEAMLCCARLTALNDARGTGTDSQLLWRMKWILGFAPYFPEISEEQAFALLRDFARRLEAAGGSPRTSLFYESMLSRDFGKVDRAMALQEEAQTHPRDAHSDCRACEPMRVIRTCLHAGDDQGALQAAAPLLSGEMKCHQVPHITYGEVLLARVRLGQQEQAWREHSIGYGMSQGEPLLETHAQHLAFAVGSGRLDEALGIYRLHVENAAKERAAGKRMLFYWAAEYLFERMALRDDRPITVELPLRSHDGDRLGALQPSFLFAHFAAEARRLEEQFDRASHGFAASYRFRIAELRRYEGPIA